MASVPLALAVAPTTTVPLSPLRDTVIITYNSNSNIIIIIITIVVRHDPRRRLPTIHHDLRPVRPVPAVLVHELVGPQHPPLKRPRSARVLAPPPRHPLVLAADSHVQPPRAAMPRAVPRPATGPGEAPVPFDVGVGGVGAGRQPPLVVEAGPGVVGVRAEGGGALDADLGREGRGLFSLPEDDGAWWRVRAGGGGGGGGDCVVLVKLVEVCVAAGP